MSNNVKKITAKYNNDANRLIDILKDIQALEGFISKESITAIALELAVSQVDIEQTLSFYHFFKTKPGGKYTVYLNESVVAEMHGRASIKNAFEKEAGCAFGSVSKDGLIGLYNTACIGMNDQEPAALINDVVFTSLTPDKVKKIVAGMREGKPVKQMVLQYGDGANGSDLIRSMVNNNIRKKGAVIFVGFAMGSAIKKCLSLDADAALFELKKSNLRGRGGAGFPTGMKWEFLKKALDPEKYIICNADEGEPGTFKDRVILTEVPGLMFEGMVIAGYITGAQQGILYLRNEYLYLKKYLEQVLSDYRSKNLLGKAVAGWQDFNFDIEIRMGAGAYICGEESGLIESVEGKRGEPRIRPPFPVEKGYLGKPTVVNNVETLCAASRIMLNGAEWFRSMGTDQSAGTKVLSISGDCERPGIYELAWGVTVSGILEMAGAHETKAVVVGGPSGTIIGPDKFSRKICYVDLATGGSIIIIGKDRDLLKIVKNFADFFCDESCGSCTPCRAGNLIIRNTVQKILDGHGVASDLDMLVELGAIMKATNRCGLGQTSANPVVYAIQNLSEEIKARLRTDTDYDKGFDLAAAIVESCEYVKREPLIEKEHA